MGQTLSRIRGSSRLTPLVRREVAQGSRDAMLNHWRAVRGIVRFITELAGLEVFLFLKVSDKFGCNSQGLLGLWLPDDLCLVSDVIASP